VEVGVVKQVGIVVGVLVAVGLMGWLVFDRAMSPRVSPGLAAMVVPVIDAELEHGPWPGMLSSTRPELAARWFCAERVIEIRRAGDEVAVGIEASCDEFAREGDALVAGSGESGPKVVVLVAGSNGYRVSRVDAPPDGDARLRWVRRSFSEDGAAQVERGSLSRDATVTQAREAFGLPPGAPVRQR
jgi:hypothetical protein